MAVVVPKHVRVLLPYNTQPDHDVEEIGGSVISHLYIAPAKDSLPTPPVDQATLQTGLTNFTAAIAATVQGGAHATNEKNKRKHELVGLLRQNGLYVQGACKEDVATLTSSGFQAASTTRVRGPLGKAVISAVDNGDTTQLLVTADPIDKAKAWQLEMATVAANGVLGEWKLFGIFTKPRKMKVTGLAAGATYAFHVRACGGTEQYGLWSDPVTHMST